MRNTQGKRHSAAQAAAALHWLLAPGSCVHRVAGMLGSILEGGEEVELRYSAALSAAQQTLLFWEKVLPKNCPII